MGQPTENLNLTQFDRSEEQSILFQAWSRDINCADKDVGEQSDFQKIDEWAGEVNEQLEGLPVDYIGEGSMDNFTQALGTKLYYTITKTFNPETQKYGFNITENGIPPEIKCTTLRIGNTTLNEVQLKALLTLLNIAITEAEVDAE